MPPTLFALVIFHTGSQVFLPRARLKLNPPTYASQGSRVTGCATTKFVPVLASNLDPPDLHLLSSWLTDVSHHA
jgi:hypothetical protein